MRYFFIFLFSGLLLSSMPAFSQSVPSFQIKYLHHGSGIEECSVNCVFKDRIGLLWVGGNRGLQYYDGLNLQSIGFPVMVKNSGSDLRISSYAEDGVGRLWVGTNEGLIILTPERSQQVQPASLGIPDSVSQAYNCNVQSTASGDVYIIAGKNVYKMASSDSRLSLEVNLGAYPNVTSKIRSFVFTPADHSFYFKTNFNNQVFRYRQGKLTNINYTIVKRFNGQSIYELPLNINHYSLFLVSDTLCLLINKTENSSGAYSSYINDKQQLVYYNFSDSIQRIFPITQAWYKYCRGPESPLIPSLRSELFINQLIRSHNNEWYIASNVGVFIVQETLPLFRQVRWTQGYSVRGITENIDNKQLLVGSYDHLFYGFPSEKTCRQISMPPPWYYFRHGKRSWYYYSETPLSINILDWERPQNLRSYPIRQKQNLAYQRAAVSTGKGFWSSRVPDTLCYFSPETDRIVSYAIKNTFHNYAATERTKSLICVDTILWSGGDRGLQSYALNATRDSIVHELTAVIPDTLRHIQINCLYAGMDGTLWIGSGQSGLLAYSTVQRKIQYWMPTDGLAHRNVYSIIGSHSDSVLWIGTEHGLSRMDVKSNTFCNYHVSDGLPSNEFNSSSVFKSDDGFIFMGGPNGVCYFQPREVRIKPAVSPGFLIVDILNTQQNIRRKLFPLTGSALTIQPEEDYVTFSFRSTDFFQNQSNVFRYHIIGLQKEWRYIHIDQQDVFTSFRPGEYLLEFQSQSNTGVWTTIYLLHLNVLPTWHQTWWFKLLVLLLITIGLHMLYLLRLGQLRKEYKLRKQVSDDLHDDLGSRIFALKLLASNLANPEQSEEMRRKASEQFENLSRDVLARVRNFIWVFNPENDKLIYFLDRMDDYIQGTIKPLVNDISFIYSDVKNIKFTSASRHHLMMVVQELLINMSKHTQLPIIRVEAEIRNAFLFIRIYNKHTGSITSADATDRPNYGLNSIQNRLQQYNIELYWLEDDGSQLAILSIEIG